MGTVNVATAQAQVQIPGRCTHFHPHAMPMYILHPEIHPLCTFNKAQKKCMASIMHFSILLSYRSYRLLPKLYRVDSTKDFLAFHDEPYC